MIRPVSPIGPVICAFGANAPMASPTNKDGPDAKRKSTKIDLADQVAKTDGEKHRKDRLRSDDFTRSIQHGNDLRRRKTRWIACTVVQRARQPAARNCSITRLIKSGVGVGVLACL